MLPHFITNSTSIQHVLEAIAYATLIFSLIIITIIIIIITALFAKEPRADQLDTMLSTI